METRGGVWYIDHKDKRGEVTATNTKEGFRRRLIFFIALMLLYCAIFLLLTRTGLFSPTHNDRLFSADDHYYSTEFFSAELDDSPRIIKHPLLIVFGCAFTRLEKAVFGYISLRRHYELIIMMQMCASVLATFFLDLILEGLYKLKCSRALTVCGIFALSFSVLFFTFIAESYILSALLLTASFYFARRHIWIVTGVLGVLTAGVTLTNGVLWALIVLLSGDRFWKRAAVIVSAAAVFCAIAAALPIRDIFYSTLLTGSKSSLGNYSDRFGFFEVVSRTFFAFFGSTLFYLKTESASPFGQYGGDALSFVPAASVPVVIAGVLWLAALVFAAVRFRRDSRIWAPLAVIAANILLHGAAQYGLKEAFLYSLHHLPAQILAVSLLLSPEAGEKTGRAAAWCATGFFILVIALNIPGYIELFRFIGQ